MKPLKIAATELKIAEIRLWSLIRKGKLPSRYMHGSVYVDSKILELYIESHPGIIETWQKDYSLTQHNFNF